MTEQPTRSFPLVTFLAFSLLLLATLSISFLIRLDDLDATLEQRIAERQTNAQMTVEEELQQQVEHRFQLAELFSRAQRVQQLTTQAYQHQEQGEASLADLQHQLRELIKPAWEGLHDGAIEELQIYLAPHARALLSLRRGEAAPSPVEADRNWLLDVLTQGKTLSTLQSGSAGLRFSAAAPIRANEAEDAEVVGLLELSSAHLPRAELLAQNLGAQLAVLQQQPNPFRRPIPAWREISHTGKEALDWQQLDLPLTLDKPHRLQVENLRQRLLISLIPLSGNPTQPQLVLAVIEDIRPLLDQHQQNLYRVIARWLLAWLLMQAFLVLLFRSQGKLQSARNQVLQSQKEMAEASQRMLELVSLAQSAFITATNHREVFDQLLLRILGFTNSAFGFFGETLHNPDGTPYLKTLAISNISWDEQSTRFFAEHAPAGMEFRNLNTLFGQVLKTGKPLLSNAPDKHPQSGGTPAGHPPLNAFLGLPIMHGQQQIGMLGLANRPGGYNEELINDLQPLLASLAQMIEATLRERTLSQQRSLQQKQQRAMAVLNEIAARPTLEVDTQIRRGMQLAAEFFCLPYAAIGKVTGDTYTLTYQFAARDRIAEGTQLPLADTYCQITLQQGDDVTAIDHMSLSAHASHACFSRAKFECYIGIPLWVEGARWGALSISGLHPRTPGFDSADLEFLRLFGRWVGSALESQIQERKRLELLQRLRQVTEQVPGIIYQLDIDRQGRRNMPYASDGLYSLCNLRPEDLLENAEAFFASIHPEDRTQVEASLQQSLHSMTPWLVEFRLQNPHGETIWLGGQATPARLTDERVRMTGLLLDIREIKQTQATLQLERQRLDRILESTAAGTWQWNVQTGEVRVNQRWAEIIGYQIHELEPQMSSWQDKTHPDDYKHAAELLERHFRGEIAYYDCEFRLRHKDGHWVWIHTRGSLISRDPAGAPLMMYGTHTDISARIEQQQENRKIQAFLETVLQSSTGVSMIATDTSGLISMFNPGAERLLGYSAEEMVGKQSPAILHVESEVLSRSAELSAEAGQPVEGFEVFVHRARQGRIETRQWSYVQKDGGIRQVMLSVSPLIGSEGEPSGFFGVASDISALVETSQALQASENRYRSMLGNLPGAVYRCKNDEQWTALHMSDEIERITGYPVSDFIGNRVRSFASIVLPEDLHIPREVTALLNTQQRFELIYRIVHAEGHPVWISDKGRGEYDEQGKLLWADGFMADISEKRQAEQMIIEREAYLRTLLDNVIDAIITIDEHGLIQSFNRAAERIFGYTQTDVLLRNVSMLMPEPDRSRHDGYIGRVHSSGEARILGVSGRALYGLRSSGEQFPMELAVSEIQYQGARRFIGVIRDITERKRIDQMKNEFVSTVSHELRTPLTSITGALGLIIGGALGAMPEAAASMLEIAYRNSQRLGMLINDLLDMDKLVAGKMPFHFSVQPLQPLIDEALQSNQAYAKEYGVSWNLQTNTEDCQVQVDTLRLQQVLANLLSNAAKFSPAGGAVTIRSSVSNGIVRISIEDQGSGIPAEFHSRIFAKFSQHDASDTRQKGGTGLGLAISKQLIERMHGHIGFDSPPGRGACFWIELPVAAQP